MDVRFDPDRLTVFRIAGTPLLDPRLRLVESVDLRVNALVGMVTIATCDVIYAIQKRVNHVTTAGCGTNDGDGGIDEAPSGAPRPHNTGGYRMRSLKSLVNPSGNIPFGGVIILATAKAVDIPSPRSLAGTSLTEVMV